MSLTKAKAIGRKRRRLGRLWPMPVRETDLGHIYAEVTVRPLAGSDKSWTGSALVDTGATDTFLPASVLRRLGIRPSARRSYELADGTEQELPIGFGVIEVLGRAAGGTLVFAGEKEEPLLGVTVLESTGFWIDPQRERLVPRPPETQARPAIAREHDMLKHNQRSSAIRILGMLLLAAACCASAAIAGARLDPRATRGENLVSNGDFENGKTTPDGWQTIDGLSTFWVDDPDTVHGRVLKLDTDVLQSQGYEWWAKILENAEAKDAPKKQPTVEPKYDTLAGSDGVWFWSDFIPVEKGKSYWLKVDVKGPGMKVFMRGYPDRESTAFGADEAAFQGFLLDRAGQFKNERGRTKFKQKYIWSAWMSAGGSDQWQTFSRREMPFSPTKNTPSVKYVRVMLYPYWPPATYYVDNVKLLEVAE